MRQSKCNYETSIDSITVQGVSKILPDYQVKQIFWTEKSCITMYALSVH